MFFLTADLSVCETEPAHSYLSHGHLKPFEAALMCDITTRVRGRGAESYAIKVSFIVWPARGSNSISRVKEQAECLPEAAEV